MRTVELTTAEEAEEAADLLTWIWTTQRHMDPPVPSHLARAVSATGGFLAGVRDDDGRLVAASFGFRGAEEDRPTLHSHVTGVAPNVQSQGIGRTLKNQQRAWAAERGLDFVTWTFDPLSSGNARFSLTALGGRALRFFESFYRSPASGPDAGDRLDRVLVVWPTSGPAEPGESVVPDEAPVVLDVSAPDSGPVVADSGLAEADGCSVAIARVPLDMAMIRRADPSLGRRWREAFSSTCGDLLASGWVMTGMTADGWYILRRAT